MIKNFQEWIYKKASVKPSVSYLATNLPGLAVISCCETAAILWEVSKSHSEGNQNIIVGWLSWIQLSISAQSFGSRRSHVHGKTSQLHHVLSSKAKQYEWEVAMVIACTRCLLAVNSAVNKGRLCASTANSNVRTYFHSMTSSSIIAWAKGYPPP